MVRQSDQEGALLLSNVSRPGNRRIRAPNQVKPLLGAFDRTALRARGAVRRDSSGLPGSVAQLEVIAVSGSQQALVLGKA
jgi:hypothetical protein